MKIIYSQQMFLSLNEYQIFVLPEAKQWLGQQERKGKKASNNMKSWPNIQE